MKYEKIVVAIDLTSESEKILKIAKSIAGESQSALHAIFVMEPLAAVYPYEAYLPELPKVHERISSESEKQLNDLADAAEFPATNRDLLAGPPASEICRHAEEVGAELIVLGSHGKSGWRALLGSTANSVVQSANCDVLTVRVGQESKG